MPAHFDLLIRNGACVLPWGVDKGKSQQRMLRLLQCCRQHTIGVGGLCQRHELLMKGLQWITLVGEVQGLKHRA